MKSGASYRIGPILGLATLVTVSIASWVGIAYGVQWLWRVL
jgi:hypothetical protein